MLAPRSCPIPPFPTTLVSDRHCDDVAPLPPIRPRPDRRVSSSSPLPTTVTLVAPVAGPFVGTALDPAALSFVTARVIVPSRNSSPTVTSTPIPMKLRELPGLLCTLDDDAHDVVRVRLPPIRPLPVLLGPAAPPMLVPTTVTLIDPVPATFVPAVLLR